MQFRKLGSSTLSVSVVGLGTWALGDDFWGSVDDRESIKAIHAAIDAGINLIDTAPAYGAGHSEEVVGKAIKDRRERVIVATKVGVLRRGKEFVRSLKPESVRAEIDDSLRRLGVDVIDLWQIHWPDASTPLEDTLGEIERIRAQGKFRYLGVSNFDIPLMEKARAVSEIVSLQPHYSLLERKIDAEILPYCASHGVGVLGYGTLAAGLLTGKFTEVPKFAPGDHRDNFYPFFAEPLFGRVQQLLSVLSEIAVERKVTVGQVATNWAISQRGMTTALVGAKNVAQAAQNAAAGDFSLSAEELARIERGYREAGLAA